MGVSWGGVPSPSEGSLRVDPVTRMRGSQEIEASGHPPADYYALAGRSVKVPPWNTPTARKHVHRRIGGQEELIPAPGMP